MSFLSPSSGLFTPDEAFEYIVQMQIAKFEEPILKCVEMVTSELLTIVHEATSKVSAKETGKVPRQIKSQYLTSDETLPIITSGH